MGQSVNMCDLDPHERHASKFGTNGTSVDARTASLCLVGMYEPVVRTVAVSDLDVPDGVGEGALTLALLVSFLPTSGGIADGGNKHHIRIAVAVDEVRHRPSLSQNLTNA